MQRLMSPMDCSSATYKAFSGSLISGVVKLHMLYGHWTFFWTHNIKKNQREREKKKRNIFDHFLIITCNCIVDIFVTFTLIKFFFSLSMKDEYCCLERLKTMLMHSRWIPSLLQPAKKSLTKCEVYYAEMRLSIKISWYTPVCPEPPPPKVKLFDCHCDKCLG